MKAVGKVPQHRLDQPHPEQSMPILCHVWEKLLLSCLFSLSPLLFFHPESFKHEALGNSREFNTMQEVLYFFFVCSSSSLISSMFHSVSPGPLLGQIKAQQSPIAELGIPVVQEHAMEQRGGKGSCSRVWALHSSQIRAGKTWRYCRKGAPSL